jgi:hypothetical protein
MAFGRILFKQRKPGSQGQIIANWLGRKQMPWNDGIPECWIGQDKIFFQETCLSETKIKTLSAFDTQYSNIPPFHYSIGQLKEDSSSLG